jgi:hypothetical protein
VVDLPLLYAPAVFALLTLASSGWINFARYLCQQRKGAIEKFVTIAVFNNAYPSLHIAPTPFAA